MKDLRIMSNIYFINVFSFYPKKYSTLYGEMVFLMIARYFSCAGVFHFMYHSGG